MLEYRRKEMVCEHMFKLKKNGEPNYRYYCRHPELIENYEKAIVDTTQTWEVHHRLECCFTQKFLQEIKVIRGSENISN